MKGKGLFRLIEWGKTLLILLLAASAVWLLGKTQFSDGMLNSVQGLLSSAGSDVEKTPAEHTHQAVIRPMCIVMTLEGGQRYGVQYDLTESDAIFSSMSTLMAEALSSAGVPQQVSERVWRTDLGDLGIYLDLHYPLPLSALSGQLGEKQRSTLSEAVVRRLCLSAGYGDSVDLLYINEADGKIYSCATTLSRSSHLEPVLTDRPANGAMFAFEVPGMEKVAPYMLLTATPQPVVYRGENPLVSDSTRLAQLLDTLSFQSRSNELMPSAGGMLVEGNDSLRLQENGVLNFHTMGNDEFRFLLAENTHQDALEYTQELANATVGKWCGGATLCLAGVQETDGGLEILYQYSLNGIPVQLPESAAAARFVVRNGAVTDFSLYFRAYTATDETTLILPEVQAAAILGSAAKNENELTLIYLDGGETVSAGWIAN